MIFSEFPKSVNLIDGSGKKLHIVLGGIDKKSGFEIQFPYIDVLDNINFIENNIYIPPPSIANLIDGLIPPAFWEDMKQKWMLYAKSLKTTTGGKFEKPLLWINHKCIDAKMLNFIKGVSNSLHSYGWQPIIFPSQQMEISESLIVVDREYTLKNGDKSSRVSICPKTCGACQNCIRGIKMQIFGETP